LKEWNERQKRVEDAKWGDDEEEEAEEEEDELPFACYLCRKPWAEIRDPVVTRCKHYFCETCALRHNSLNKGKCAICEQPTNGIFNVANDIVKKVKVQKKKDDEGN
jgi:RING finger protein 113A